MTWSSSAPVGCEYASIFAALGVRVTLLDVADRLLPFMDAEVSAGLARAFEEMGMRVLLGSGMALVERVGGALQVRLTDGEIPPEARRTSTPPTTACSAWLGSRVSARPAAVARRNAG